MIKRKTETRYVLDLDRSELLALVRARHPDVSPHADVFVHIPGGGDRSNEDLEIDRECPLLIRWNVTTEDEAT